MDALVVVANLLYIGAYFVKDMLRLRILSLGGACLLALYFSLREQPLMNVAVWNLFYVTLNAVWIWRLIRERRQAWW